MTAFEWSPLYRPAVYLGLGLALLVLMLLGRRLAKSPSARKWPLLALRLALLALLVLLLLNPVAVTETRLPPRPPEVMFLVDCSRSMALDRPTSRLEQVKNAIAQVKLLVPGFGRPGQGPRVSLFRFGQQLLACSTLEELRAEDEATKLLEALERLPSHFELDRPGGVVVFSDGRATEANSKNQIPIPRPRDSDFVPLAEGYRRLGVPIHVYPVGDLGTIGDVAIQEIVAPRDARPGSRVPIRVQVRSRGYSGRRAEIRIRSLAGPSETGPLAVGPGGVVVKAGPPLAGSPSPTQKPLATIPFTLADGEQIHELIIEPDQAAGQLVVEVPPLEGEAILENNCIPLRIGSRKGKVRVIYMEGTLNNEYHWLRDALVEDPNIECLAMEVNNQYDIKPTLHRVGDPRRGYPTTREEMFNYDVVICSDIKRASFTQEQVGWTHELVAKRGGGFAMIGGNTSFGAGYWDQTLWDGLIPVSMGGQANSPGRGTCWGLQFFVKVPLAAERHPIWRMVDDPIKNRQILARMPMFTGSNLVEGLKPAATPLGFSDRPLPRVGVMPVFACETFGKGRTFAMTTDTTDDWGHYFERNWGEAGDNRYYRKFWRNVVLWLAENSVGGNRRLRVETDKVLYRPGQPIKITAHAYDDKMEQTSRYRLVARLHPGDLSRPEPSGSRSPFQSAVQEITLSAQNADRIYRGELTMPAPVFADGKSAPQVLSLDLAAYDKDQATAQTTLDVQVLDDPVEFYDPRPDPASLEELAQASGGKVLHSPEELAQVLRGLNAAPGEVIVNRFPVWDHSGVWLILLALLTVEWVLRRWWGLA
jgi:uncharacterized membrane protein